MEIDPLVGKQLGAYLIQSKLGEGGMARVYKAYHARLRRDVAIKVILPQVADQAGFKARYEREAQLAASLEYRNIVAVYDFGEIGNLTYLVMQYVGGGTLRDRLGNQRPLEPRRAALYALQMARALHHAHLRGIVHRDVKPQNMLVSAGDPNELLLSDFGIAKIFDSRYDSHPDVTYATATPASVESQPGLTNVGQMVGTAEYMAPEQINMKQVDARTDVYALGAVLFQMLTGQVPFQSTTVLGLLYQHVNTPPRPVRELNPNVPDLLAQVTAKALAKAPEQRFQTAEEMAQALEMVTAPSIHPFSSTSGENYATYGRSTGDAVTQLSQGHITSPNPSSYGQPVTYPSGPATQAPGRFTTTGAGGGSLVGPPLTQPKSKFRASTILTSVVLLLTIGILLVKFLPSILPPGTPETGSGGAAKPFTENFQNNDRNWPSGVWGQGHLTASLSPNKYILTIDDKVTSTTYFFPHPYAAAVGTLPTNYTLTVQIGQDMGGTDAFYGLAFRLKQNEDGSKVYCYAFVIDGKGDYEVWKYDSDAPVRPNKAWVGQLPSAIHGLHQTNTLQVVVRGSSFSFQINNMPVPVGAQSTDTTYSDTTFTDGQIALMVSGPSTSFTVTQVKLDIP